MFLIDAIRYFGVRWTKNMILAAAVGAGIVACQTMAQKTNVLSDSKIISESAPALGYQPSDLTLLSRKTVGTNTYAVLRANDSKEFHCMINGGNLLTWGMTNPPVCSPVGQPLRGGSPFTQGQ